MCQFFTCNIDKNKKVYWKRGVDSHKEIQRIFRLKEPKLSKPPTNQEISEKIQWAKVEIVPKNKDYLVGPIKSKWVFKVDEPINPIWWNKSYEKPCWEAWKQAIKIYEEFNWKEAKNPIHPFKIKAPKITKKHINLLKKWASVWDSVRASVEDSVWASVRASVRASVEASVGDSVWASVWASVGDSVWASVGDSVWASVWASVGASVWASVRASVWDSVRASVRASVWDSVGAYTGSLFSNIKSWEYVDYKKLGLKKSEYSFASAEKLWRKGLVPTFDSKLWSLYGSPKGDGKAKTLWKGKL